MGTNTIYGSYEVTRPDLCERSCGKYFQNCHADPVPFRVALTEKPLPEYSNAQLLFLMAAIFRDLFLLHHVQGMQGLSPLLQGPALWLPNLADS